MTTSTQFMMMYGVTYGRALEMVREEREANKKKREARAAAAKASPIAAAVEPLKADAIKSANEWAHEEIAYVRAEMEKAGWDRGVAAPYPKSLGMSRIAYMKAKLRYDRFRSLTVGRKGSRGMHEPDFADMSPDSCKYFVDECEKQAASQYEAFVAKLVYKIGEAKTAVLDGNHVWALSVLTVTKPDGSIERWQTKQITNVSKLGKYFPQWPSRKLKRK